MLTINRLTLATAILFAAACGDDEPTPVDMGMTPDMGMATPDMGMATPDMGATAANIVETAQQAGLTDLLQAATTAGLASTLSDGGPFTVFAPTNAAFAALGANTPSDPGLLANVLLHHVVAGPGQDSAAVLGAASLTSAAKTTLTVDSAATPATVGGAPLSSAIDVVATNGIVHVIDAVMIPPRIDEAVGANTDLSTLGTAVGASSMAVQNTLSGPGPITVFAPVNSAFANIDLSTLTQAQVDSILTYHVVTGQTLSTDLSDGQTITTAQGGTLTVNATGNGVTLTDAAGATVNVTTTDIRLLNGVVHLIDGVLSPTPPATDNIVQLAQQAGLTSLLGAATTAGLADTLANGGPFTVFAPTDAAFTALGAAAPSDPGLLANVLLNHVVPGIQMSPAVLAAASLTSAANTGLAVDAAATPPTVGGAPLSSTIDQMATNGVVHIIDQVIVPPTIAGAAGALPDLSTLNTAVGAAAPAVAATLSGPGPITVFAPVNSAFTGLDVNALVADQERLTDILTYHVTTGQALSTDLMDGQTITMANGLTLTVNVAGGAVTLTDGLGNTARVIQADVRLLNGTVHLIDGVLNSGNIVERADAAGLTTLVGAVNRVNLDGALRGAGPFTVFAPTEAAFTALNVNLANVDDGVLSNILLHHVVAGRNDSTAVLAAGSLNSLANLPLAIGANPATVGGASLSSTLDVPANNGIVHLLDTVIVPPTITEVAASVPDLSTVVSALGLASAATQTAVNPTTLTGAAPITVLAPLNNAFSGQNIDVNNTPQALLDAVLGYHVIPGQLLTSEIGTAPRMVTTAAGGMLTLTRSGNVITVTDATGGQGEIDLSLRDIRTLTGIVHVIDRVLQPQ